MHPWSTQSWKRCGPFSLCVESVSTELSYDLIMSISHTDDVKFIVFAGTLVISTSKPRPRLSSGPRRTSGPQPQGVSMIPKTFIPLS